jgi:hypothetical protein
MKKLLLAAMIVLIGCAGRTYVPYYDHTLIKQVSLKNPTFVLAVENDDKNYYLNQIEDAFIRNKITIISGEKKISNTNIEGRAKGIAYNYNSGLVNASSKSKSSIVEKTIDIDNTDATCTYILDNYNSTFKVIFNETKELIMKGYIRNDYDSEILKMYQTLTNQAENINR